jgi:hypothetical protein
MVSQEGKRTAAPGNDQPQGYPLRKREHFKLNRNFFQVFISPFYRLCFSLFPYQPGK